MLMMLVFQREYEQRCKRSRNNHILFNWWLFIYWIEYAQQWNVSNIETFRWWGWKNIVLSCGYLFIIILLHSLNMWIIQCVIYGQSTLVFFAAKCFVDMGTANVSNNKNEYQQPTTHPIFEREFGVNIVVTFTLKQWLVFAMTKLMK